MPMTITNDRTTPTSLGEHRKLSLTSSDHSVQRRSSADRHRRKRAQPSRPTDKIPEKKTRKSSSAENRTNCMLKANSVQSSDDDSSMVAIQTRVSSATKSVRRYRTVQLHRDRSDDDSDDEGATASNPKQQKSTAVNKVSGKKTPGKCERESSEKAFGADRSKERSGTPGSSRHGGPGKHGGPMREARSCSLEKSHRSKSSHHKRRSAKL